MFGLLSDLLGTVVRRNVDQARNGGADGIDIPGWAIEVKRQECGFQNAWWEQACEQGAKHNAWPVLAYRASRQPWRVRILLCSAWFSFADSVLFVIPTYSSAWCEVDLPTFAMIVRESLPKEPKAA